MGPLIGYFTLCTKYTNKRTLFVPYLPTIPTIYLPYLPYYIITCHHHQDTINVNILSLVMRMNIYYVGPMYIASINNVFGDTKCDELMHNLEALSGRSSLQCNDGIVRGSEVTILSTG